MSIIVAVQGAKEIVFASDTQSNFGNFRVSPDNHSGSKVRRVGDCLMGITGWSLYENIFDDYLSRQKTIKLLDERSIFAFFLKFWKELDERYPFVNQQCNDEDSPFVDLDATFLLGNKSGIFYVSGDMGVTPFKKYFAIGSGSDFALGALHTLYDSKDDPSALATTAVAAALEFDSKCGGRVELNSIALAAQ